MIVEFEGQQHQFPDDFSQADIAAALGSVKPAQEDEYRTAARQDQAALKASGAPTPSPLVRRMLQGATFNSADEILAGAMTPLEMIRRGTFNPAEGYRYAKAREDLSLEDARKNSGIGGTIAELGGGLLSGVGLANAGLTTSRMLAPNAGIMARSLSSAADAGAMGAAAGAMEGNSLNDRAKNAAVGLGLGAGIGALAPGALAVGGSALSPLISNIRARINPESYAQTQVARSVMESGRTPQQIADEVATAAREGQGMYTLADAMGNAGQRMLSTTARAPGPGRTAVVDFLEGRQADQGRRVANTLAEGFDAPVTAEQTRSAMTAARDTAADTAYGAARNNAGAVDVTPVLARIDATLQPGVNQVARPASGIANDTAEAALESVRRRLSDGRSNLSDFTAIQRVRGDLSDMVQAAQRTGRGNQARLLGGVLREMDAAMENASAGFRQANADFARRSRNIEAIDQGATAATRGRTEDIIPQFRALPPQGQAGYRAGYVDPLIQQAQGAAFGVNKARPLTSDAFAAESAAIAPMRTQTQMTRRLERENRMFETRNQALGGSKTADNLADQSAMGIDPSILMNLLTGNIGGAAKQALSAGSNLLNGNTPQVRDEVARILMQRGQGTSPQQMQQALDDALRRIQIMQLVARQSGRGAAGALAIAPAATDQRQRR